jgi:hypothetical protein
MESTPRWIPIFFGSVMVMMGGLILGAQLGFVPTGDGEWLAPPTIIVSLSLSLILGGFLLWIPQNWPVVIRTAFLLATIAAVVTVCNWTAFAPGVVYYSSTSIGPVTFEGESSIGGRIVFIVAALAVDIFVLSMLIGWFQARTGDKKSE